MPPTTLPPLPVTHDASAGLALGWGPAVDALEKALVDGLDPEVDPERILVEADACTLMVMPSRLAGWTGTKLVTICGANAERGLPLVQGLYVLFDSGTGVPAAVLDGGALTALRTPAVSALAVRHLATRPVEHVTIIGTGVQAAGHADALLATTSAARISIVGRSADRAAPLVEALRERGVEAVAADLDAVREADVVVCTTRSRTPVLDGDAVRPDAVVVAMGSHTVDTREVDTALVARSQVVIESRQSALRENGDVLMPISEGVLDERDLLTLSEVVAGRPPSASGRPRLFTGTGMPWQDLVVAAAVVDGGGGRRD